MKLTTRGRYAVTAMLDLAVHASDGAVPLADIAERQSLSLAYLEQLFAGLRKAGLVESLRGPGGGYLLARSAAEIRVAEVIAAVDEPVDVTRCGGLVNCNQDSQCLTHDLWVELSRQVRLFFESRSLQDVLLRRAEVRGLVSPSHPGSPPREPRRHIPIVAVP
jgi:Rrf2 family iron-sulfur cluster assembly transcriptional regulator